jgi:hypothetical protein
MPGSIHPIFLWHIACIGGDDQLRRSSKMTTMAAILDLVSVDFLTNAWVDWADFFGGSLGSFQ